MQRPQNLLRMLTTSVVALLGSYPLMLSATVDPNASEPIRDEVRNMSCRTTVAPGGMATVGFIVDTPYAMLVLIRAVGPGLLDYGVENVMTDPQLILHNTSRRLLINDNWEEGPPATAWIAANARTGAFPLKAGSLDAGLIVLAQPGAYTVQVNDRDGNGGEVLLEIYRVHANGFDSAVQTWASVPEVGQDPLPD